MPTGPRPLGRALGAYALFALVELSAWLAVVLFAFDLGGAALASGAAVAQLVPAAILSPVLAGLAERVTRGTALIAAHAAVAVTALITAVMAGRGVPVPVVIMASALLTTAIAVVRPLHFASLPQLAGTPKDLISANSLSSVADSVAVFAGPVLAGFAASEAGPWLVLGLDAVAAAAAALLCVHLPLSAPVIMDREDDDAGWPGSFKGLAVLRSNRAAVSLIVVLTGTFVIAGALDVLGVAFSEVTLNRGQSGAGLLLGAVGIGGLAGAFLAAPLVARRWLTPVIVAGGVGQGLAVAAVAAIDLLPPAMGALAVAGFCEAVLLVAGRTLLQRTVDDRVLARIFAVQEAMSLLGLGAGAGLAPVLIATVSPAGAFAPLGVLTAALCLGCLALIRQLDAKAVYLPNELELLRAAPFLAVLPPYDLERLARRATWINVPPGTAVFRQGDPGSVFYLVGAGELTVTVDGLTNAEPMRAGDAFGEIALLRSVPRTATVRSTTPSRMLTIQSQDFLAAVTGSPDGRKIASEVAAAHMARDQSRNA